MSIFRIEELASARASDPRANKEKATVCFSLLILNITRCHFWHILAIKYRLHLTGRELGSAF